MNLNGLWYEGGDYVGDATLATGITWKQWKGMGYALKEVYMRLSR